MGCIFHVFKAYFFRIAKSQHTRWLTGRAVGEFCVGSALSGACWKRPGYNSKKLLSQISTMAASWRRSPKRKSLDNTLHIRGQLGAVPIASPVSEGHDGAPTNASKGVKG
jgi:hypothetical protein